MRCVTEDWGIRLLEPESERKEATSCGVGLRRNEEGRATESLLSMRWQQDPSRAEGRIRKLSRQRGRCSGGASDGREVELKGWSQGRSAREGRASFRPTGEGAGKGQQDRPASPMGLECFAFF